MPLLLEIFRLCHQFILDFDDADLMSNFSSEDIEELQSFGSKPVPGIDDNLGHYLKNLPISEVY